MLKDVNWAIEETWCQKFNASIRYRFPPQRIRICSVFRRSCLAKVVPKNIICGYLNSALDPPYGLTLSLEVNKHSDLRGSITYDHVLHNL